MSSASTLSDTRRRRLLQSLTAGRVVLATPASGRRLAVKDALVRHIKPCYFSSGVVENTIQRARLLAFSIPSYGWPNGR